jgi:hypothetical protein
MKLPIQILTLQLSTRVTRLYNAKDLEKLLFALMANVKRYPEDKLSILRCLCEVGKRHDDYIGMT